MSSPTPSGDRPTPLASPASPPTPGSRRRRDSAGFPGLPRRTSTASSNISGRLRRASQSFEVSRPPGGFLAATSDIASSLLSGASRAPPPSMAGADASTSDARQRDGAPVTLRPDAQTSSRSNSRSPPAADPEKPLADGRASRDGNDDGARHVPAAPPAAEPFDNGYHFPPSYPKGESFRKGAVAFARYAVTPLGFFVVVYGLLVVAWGGMLFLLLCNASPAMCHPTCNALESPRRKWIEVDSQVVNALFCVTGFGLAPWRFRDLYYLLRYRLLRDPLGLRRLAGIHRTWLRLPGSDTLPATVGPVVDGHASAWPDDYAAQSRVPYPESQTPDAPLTGRRAAPTPVWKLDLVVWLFVANTLLQVCLSVFMWSMNRFNRPSWAVGLFVALACVVAAAAGLIMFFEGKRVKSIEGVPLTQQDRDKLSRDREMGIPHYNNIKDRKPKGDSR